jgi:hypothetical protein
MRQLSGLDSAFLNLENATQFGHVSGLSIFTRPDIPGYGPYAAWKEQLEERLHLLEPLRRRLAEVPLGLDHPFWINDPDFDLQFHVRHTAVPPPGSDEARQRRRADRCPAAGPAAALVAVLCDRGLGR